jgi:hypothetical protein
MKFNKKEILMKNAPVKKERQKLSIDLEVLFPGSSFAIGNEVIVIRPLNIDQLSEVALKLAGLGDIIEKKGITQENFNTPKNLLILASTILTNVPSVLEEAANLDIEDLKKLPPDIIVELIKQIIAENLKAKESLEKNCKSLIEKFPSVVDQVVKAAPTE